MSRMEKDVADRKATVPPAAAVAGSMALWIADEPTAAALPSSTTQP